MKGVALLNNKKEKEKEKRIKAEKNKLYKLFDNLEINVDSDKKNMPVFKLLDRLAFMKITLEDLETDINENGYVEMFSQSDKVEPYERKRPAVEIYNSLIKNFSTVCKQVQDLLPKGSENSSSEKEFLEFIASAKKN